MDLYKSICCSFAFFIFFLHFYNFGMTFEYDENKSKSNKLKYGVDFEEAKELWDDR